VTLPLGSCASNPCAAPDDRVTDPSLGDKPPPMDPRRLVTLAVVALAWASIPATTHAAPPPKDPPATGTWVGLRGGPPRMRTALAAALQTQASIRGIIDRTAVDPVSLQACRWSDLDCFVALGQRHGSRVILVGDLAKVGRVYQLRVARINVEQGEVIAAYQLTVDPAFVAIETANAAIAGLTAAVVAKPTELATPVDREPEATACARQPRAAKADAGGAESRGEGCPRMGARGGVRGRPRATGARTARAARAGATE
jgi:hypothetical protein